MKESAFKAGAAIENLLFKCAGGTAGQSLLIVHEARDDGFYNADLHEVIAEHAKKFRFFHSILPNYL